MNTETALAWLEEHQDLAEDAPQATVDRLDEVRRYFLGHTDPRCIPLILGMFGDHMGWGVFQVFDDVLRKYDQAQLTPHIFSALRSPRRGARSWATQWAMEFVSPELAPALVDILANPEDDDMHYFAIAALVDIVEIDGDSELLAVLRKRALMETDPERIELLHQFLPPSA